MLYVFDHLIHKSSDAPYYRGSILYGQTVPFIFLLIAYANIDSFILSCFFALVLNTVDIALVKSSFRLFKNDD